MARTPFNLGASQRSAAELANVTFKISILPNQFLSLSLPIFMDQLLLIRFIQYSNIVETKFDFFLNSSQQS